MIVRDLGEFGLIQRLADRIARDERQRNARLVLGIGDDAAAWRADGDIELLTTDTMVQDVHFRAGVGTWRDLGWKAMAVNVSDIAAMGGAPRYAVVTLGLPARTPVSAIDELYEGMLEMADRYPVVIVGGDIVAAPVFFVTVAVTGAASQPEGRPVRLLTRSAAAVGDVVAVTGYVGSSAGGMRLLHGGVPARAASSPDSVAYLTRAHLRPEPRVAEGQALLQCGVRAAIDVSDGLVGDLRHICEMSRVAARMRTDLVPVHPALGQLLGDEALSLALSGGEDYELLFTAPSYVVERARRTLSCPVTVIGDIVEGAAGMVTLLDADGTVAAINRPGWDHFRP